MGPTTASDPTDQNVSARDDPTIAHGKAGREQRREVNCQPVPADDVEVGRTVQRAVRGYLVDEQRELVVRALELKSPMHAQSFAPSRRWPPRNRTRGDQQGRSRNPPGH